MEGPNEKAKSKSYVYSNKSHRRSLGQIGRPLNFLNESEEHNFDGKS